MTSTTNGPGPEARAAPWYSIPSHSFVSVEHPCIVRNVDKALATLQGGEQISKLVASPHQDTQASLKLNPDDRMSKSLLSTSKQANNILLKITVPKRTGRKRKRGSQEPYQFYDDDAASSASAVSAAEDGVQTVNAKDLLQRLKDNVGKYHVEAVGRIERNHVFRAIPDFVYSLTASPFVSKLREHIFPFQYEKMKQFQLDMSKGGNSGADIIPPPSLSSTDIPFNYFYRQNPSVKQLVDQTGNVTTVNIMQANKILTHMVPFDVPTVPSEPSPKCPPISSLDQVLQDTIAAVKALFQKRLAWTRRALRNALTSRVHRYQLRNAIPYVAYLFRSGPWRDALVKLGHDPRKDPESRVYQTMMFRLIPGSTMPDVGGGEAGNGFTATKPGTSDESHIFTGQPPLYTDAKSWMVLDITDPILKENIFSLPPMPTCDIVASGWYPNVRMATARAIMRVKIQYMLENKDEPFPREWEEEIMPLFRLPAHVANDEEVGQLSVTENARCSQMSAIIRETIRSAEARVGNVRSSERAEDGGVEGQARKRVRWEVGGGGGEEEEEEEEDDQEERDGVGQEEQEEQQEEEEFDDRETFEPDIRQSEG
ncbi:hypothetical protein VTO42DRAFT_2191 [Malbranchea cinnamomea]